jgi:anti-repressor protein
MQVNELITVSTNDRNEPTVSARELYKYLELADGQFSRWARANIIENIFAVNGDDWVGFDINVEGNPVSDYVLTVPFAKKLSMASKTERGEEVRNYFLRVEKDFNSPEKVMARALKIADEELRTVKAQLQIAAPKAEGYDTLMSSGDCISIGEMAKLLKTGQNRLFRFLRGLRVLMSDNIPYQEHIDAGRFRVIEQSWKFDGAAHIGFKTLVTPKGQDYIRKVWEPLKIGERDARDRA